MFSWPCARCGRENPPSVVNCLTCGARYDDPPEGAAEVVPEEAAAHEEAALHEELAPEEEVPYEYEAEPEYEEEVEPEPPPPPPPPPRPRPVARPAAPPPVARPAAPPVARPAAPPLTRPAAPPVARPAPPVARPAAPPIARALPPRPVTPAAPAASAEPARSGLPVWLMTVLFFFAIVGIGAAIYYGIDYFRNRKPSGPVVDAAANVARSKLSNPLQKYIEVVGIRLVQDAKKHPQARFIVVNHSSEELDDVTATVTLRASTSKSDEDAVGSFTFKIGSLGAFSSKEETTPLTTTLKPYELPDWQNMTPDLQVTSP